MTLPSRWRTTMTLFRGSWSVKKSPALGISDPWATMVGTRPKTRSRSRLATSGSVNSTGSNQVMCSNSSVVSLRRWSRARRMRSSRGAPTSVIGFLPISCATSAESRRTRAGTADPWAKSNRFRFSCKPSVAPHPCGINRWSLDLSAHSLDEELE
ncbi:hypothetical protein RHCRD62_70309 [Rhodococcus sp. RD6.2]|nr:hypothetical protein RHCRD62_70309 [Rhodococcus sp. RD6.2]